MTNNLLEPAAHMYPSDLDKFQTSETFATAFSVAVGSPDERSVPLYLRGESETLLPHAYLLAKLAMVMPLFQEARDALTALNAQQRATHGISKTLADRMDIAGTYSIDDWQLTPNLFVGQVADPSKRRL